MRKIIVLIVVQILMISCQNQNSEKKEYYDSGELKEVKYYNEKGEECIRKERNVLERSIIKTVNYKKIITFKNCKPSPVEIKKYDEDGKLWLKRNYLDTVLVGSFEQYYNNDSLFVKRGYND